MSSPARERARSAPCAIRPPPIGGPAGRVRGARPCPGNAHHRPPGPSHRLPYQGSEAVHILLIAGAFNSLTQRVHAELGDRGHRVGVELVTVRTPLLDVVRRHAPDLIVAPMLTTAVPREVWSAHTCLIVHPGPVGDRGPSSVDWAVHLG